LKSEKNHMPAHVEDSKLLGERLGWPRIAISEGSVSDKITLCQLAVSLKAGMDIFSGLEFRGNSGDIILISF